MTFDYTFCFSSIRKFKKESKEFYVLSVLDENDTFYSFTLSIEEGNNLLDFEKHNDIKLPIRIIRNDNNELKIGIDHKRFKELF